MRLAVQYLPRRYLLVITLISIISACATTPQELIVKEKPTEIPTAPIIERPEFGVKPKMVTADEIFQLSLTQQQAFLDYFNTQREYSIERHEIVADYLDRFISSFNYYSETLIAQESLSEHKGNCLSLAILTSAYAKLAGVEVGYQLMDTKPVYIIKGNTEFTAQHVRSILYDPDYVKEEDFVLFMKPRIVIDYFPQTRTSVRAMVDEKQFISMYFRNIAADAIAKADYKSAFWLAKESLDYEPNNQHALNMLAIIYDRMNRMQDAENIYQFALSQTQDEVELLDNYRIFLKKNKRYAEADDIQKLIKKLDKPNPLDWLNIADKELNKGNLSEALKYYDKVVELAPYLHHGYAGQAKVEFLRGNTMRAKIAFKKAEELSVDEETSLLMRAKLSALKKYDELHD